ncbi:MAG: DUF2726 domain-containing protein [Candidatus Taylorbacteria bacterium]|nr:DUF2726 domain-containing protein [Candidatus Taylorbacteria bacterium]
MAKDILFKALLDSFVDHWQAWLVIFLFVIILVLATFFLPKGKVSIGYSYRRRDCIMTPSEHVFFKVMLDLFADRYHVFPQVHLDAILDGRVSGQNPFGAFRHINEKSVDFLICDKLSDRPMLAIELDDHSHDRADRIERDREVERIFATASLPILRIKIEQSKDVESVRNLVREKIDGVANK